MPAAFTIAADCAAVIVDLDGMRSVNGARIFERQARPMRMRDRHESAGLAGAADQVRACFLTIDRKETRRVGRCEIIRQPNSEDMPKLAVLHRT